MTLDVSWPANELMHLATTRLFPVVLGALAPSRAPTPPQATHPIPAESVCTASSSFDGPCYTVHGRMRWYNGTPGPRIWVIGTSRELGVEEEELYGSCVLPKELRRLLTSDWRLDREVFADFVVRLRTLYHRGWMQHVCVASAGRLIARKIPFSPAPAEAPGSADGALDSVRYLEIATEAYRDFMRDGGRVKVDSFARDTGGVLIILGPENPHVRGGGLLVRVTKLGIVKIVEVYP
jgi:hypothetical protein